MSRRRPAREPRIAKSLAEIAEIWGCSPQAVGLWQSQPGFPRNPDGTLTIKDVLRWRFRAETPLVAVGDDDLGSGDSPALEAYRWARAKQEEIKLAQMQGRVLPADWVNGFLMEQARTIQHAGQRLRQIGDERAAGILDDALDGMQQRVAMAMEAGNLGLRDLWESDDDERNERPETEPATAGDPAATGV